MKRSLCVRLFRTLFLFDFFKSVTTLITFSFMAQSALIRCLLFGELKASWHDRDFVELKAISGSDGGKISVSELWGQLGSVFSQDTRASEVFETCAVAINEEFVPQPEFSTTFFYPGKDTLALIPPISGG